MNLEHAQFFANRYNDMIEEIKKQLTPPKRCQLESINIEGDQVQITWEEYIGCGEYEKDTDYQRLSDFFPG